MKKIFSFLNKPQASFTVKQKFNEIILDDKEVEEKEALRNIRKTLDFNKENNKKISLKYGVDWKVNHATIIYLSYLGKKRMEKNIIEQKEKVIEGLDEVKKEVINKNKLIEESVKKELEEKLLDSKGIIQRKAISNKTERKIERIRSKKTKELKKLDSSTLKEVNKKEAQLFEYEEQARKDMSQFLSSVIYRGLHFFTNEISTDDFETDVMIIKNLSKRIKAENRIVTILDDIDLSIKKGEIVAIMGQSGSGKTTLLNIMSGIDNATSGDVLFNGINLTYLDDKDKMRFRKKNVSIVFQGHNLLDNISVYANSTIGKGFSSKKTKKKDVLEALKLLGIYELRHRYPSKLSGGQKQRVALARAILKYPKVLFCDEPTAALDKATGQEIVNILKELRNKYGMTIVIITHTPWVAKQADRVLKIENGKLLDVQTKSPTIEKELDQKIIDSSETKEYLYLTTDVEDGDNEYVDNKKDSSFEKKVKGDKKSTWWLNV